ATPVVTDGVVVAQQTPGLVDPHPHREPDQVGDVLSPGASLGCGQQAEHPRLGGPVAGRTSAVLRTRPPGLQGPRQAEQEKILVLAHRVLPCRSQFPTEPCTRSRSSGKGRLAPKASATLSVPSPSEA